MLNFCNSLPRTHNIHNWAFLHFQTGLYKLNVSDYHGNGGDGLTGGYNINGMSFSTPDRDNDKASSSNCASHSSQGGGSGWWFNNCLNVNPNGLNYGFAKAARATMMWASWGTELNECLKTITMAIRRADIPGDN